MIRKEVFSRVVFSAVLASPLFFYLLYLERAEIPILIMTSMFGFWIVGMAADLRITLSIKDKIRQHEYNYFFRELYKKYPVRKAVFLQILLEAALVLVLPSIAIPKRYELGLFWDVGTSSIVAVIVGVIHIIAWKNNKKAIREMENDDDDDDYSSNSKKNLI